MKDQVNIFPETDKILPSLLGFNLAVVTFGKEPEVVSLCFFSNVSVVGSYGLSFFCWKSAYMLCYCCEVIVI